MITLVKWLLVALVVARVSAYQAISAANFVDLASAFEVSSVTKCPPEFIKRISNEQKLKGKVSKEMVDPSTSGSAIEINADNGVFLLSSDDNHAAFYLNITIDNSVLPLLVDTASPYVWVYGENCTSQACVNKQLFTPNNSSTIKPESFALLYSSSTASGVVADVDLIINEQLAIHDFNIGLASQVPEMLLDYNISGVIGLPSDQSASNTSSLQNLVQVLYDQQDISEQIFTILLNNGSSNYDGILTIGVILHDLYQGNISYTPVINNEENYWQVEISNVYMDGFQVEFTDNQQDSYYAISDSRLAIVDSGTTIMTLNRNDAATLHSFFQNSVSDGTNFAIYCNETLEIDLTIGDLNFTIGPDSYLGQRYPQDSLYHGYCVSNFQGLNIDREGSWILGGLFLKNVYSIFDYQQQKIGFAYKNYNDVEIVSLVNNSPDSSTSQFTNASSTTTTSSSSRRSSTHTLTTSTTSSTSSTASRNSSSVARGESNMISKSSILSFISLILGLLVI